MKKSRTQEHQKISEGQERRRIDEQAHRPRPFQKLPTQPNTQPKGEKTPKDKSDKIPQNSPKKTPKK